jgi:hypothetical protein
MEPCSFEGENTILARPEDMTAEQCDPLSVLRTKDTQGLPLVISCWKPTREEMREIQRTGRVWLSVVGETMPPAVLLGRRPFDLLTGAVREPIRIKGASKDIDQREATRRSFLYLCQQYSAMGERVKELVAQHMEMAEQLKSLSELLSPYLQGQQDLTPQWDFEVEE